MKESEREEGDVPRGGRVPAASAPSNPPTLGTTPTKTSTKTKKQAKTGRKAVGPRSLKELRAGVNTPGDSTNSPTRQPDWFDKHEYEKTKEYFRFHAAPLAITWHCSLVIG
jgi:hypothetical protein